jgi:hypothetical protein
MKIKFDRPVLFELDLLEIDDHLPSVKMQLKITYDGFEHNFTHELMLWFDCKEISNFLSRLNVVNFNNAVLNDIGGIFFMELKSHERDMSLIFRIKKRDILNNFSGSLDFAFNVNNDFRETIKKSFNEFPVWWE